MGIFRSEEILHKKIRIPKENCLEIMEGLGELEDSLEFIDLNINDLEAKKYFIDSIKRIDKSEKKIKNIYRIFEEFNLKFSCFKKYENFEAALKEDRRSHGRLFGQIYYDYVENYINENEKKLIDLLNSFNQLQDNIEELIDKKFVWEKTYQLITNNSFVNENNMNYINVNNVNINNNFELENNQNQSRRNDRSGINNNIEFNYNRINNFNNNNNNNDIIDIESNNAIESRVFDLKIVSGTISAEEELKFKKLIFRTTKGIAYPNIFELEYAENQMYSVNGRSLNSKGDESSTQVKKKKIFVLCIQGQGLLMQKVLKVCDLIRAARYGIPNKHEFSEEIKRLQKEIEDKKLFLIETENSIRNFVNETEEHNIHKKLILYKIYLIREKIIYNNLNKCSIRDSFVDGELWIRKSKLPLLRNYLSEFSIKSESASSACLIDLQPTHLSPPTFLQTNSLIKPFQEIIDTFSVPEYREINPACFAIVTFPFLFGVMFGDMGHGMLLVLLGSYMFIFRQNIAQSKDAALKPLLDLRYIILFFGFCAFYSGLIYNEFFSLPIPIFNSCYKNTNTENNKLNGFNDSIPNNNTNYFNFTGGNNNNYNFTNNKSNVGNVTITTTTTTTNYISFQKLSKSKNCVYPIGVDPTWNIAKNELNFLNSLKMKLSVIIGVLHMMLGILLSGINFINKKQYSNLLTVFLPKIIFMGALFGYLCVMIVFKWTTDWETIGLVPPSLINQFLNIFLKGGAINDTPLYGKKDENGLFQETVHFWILIAVIILVPLMWLPKPIIDYYSSSKKSRNLINSNSQEEISMRSIEINNILRNEPHLSQMQSNPDLVSEHEHSFMEIFIDHSIETIEFILGSVSNTASYLRLWALSLAHSQLSKVFLEKILLSTIRNGKIFPDCVTLFFAFFVFANVTIGVLMSMDLMECFLHTLRLHWVEFMNKFYKGNGYRFESYYFKRMIKLD